MKNFAVALTLAGLWATSSAAHADAWARAYNDVTNFIITPTNVSTLGQPTANSSAAACLPNGQCVSTGGAGFSDAGPASIGLPLYADNSYANNLALGTSYAVADASIDAQQALGAPYTRARSLAEGKLVGDATATANGGNSSATLLSASFVVGGSGNTVNFQFDAQPFVLAALATPRAGWQAQAAISLNFSLIDSAGNIVFNWAPDGAVGNIVGGVENRDAFTLNTSLTALPGNNGPLVFDPTACAVGTAGGCFSATTNLLAAGIYTLNLAMGNSINLQAAAVPEPASYAMLLAGLAMAGAVARRGRRRAL